MNGFRRLILFRVLVFLWLSASGGLAWADESETRQDDQLSLADLVGYCAALSGKATADDARPSDPPARVGFRDLWERPDAYRGRRVTVRGRVARIFRQGPVGSFPPCSRSGPFRRLEIRSAWSSRGRPTRPTAIAGRMPVPGRRRYPARVARPNSPVRT